MFSTFPRIKFVDTVDIHDQFRHTLSEIEEVKAELRDFNLSALVEELLDLQQSGETCLRILEEKYGVDIEEARAKVIKKNTDRGYYTV